MVINTTAKEAFLPFTVSGSVDHGLPHGFWQQHRSQTSMWPLTAAWPMDINIASGGSTDHRHPCCPWLQQDHGHQHGLRWQHRPHTSTWPSVTTQTTVTNMAQEGNTSHGHQRDLRGQHRHPHRPLASMWLREAACPPTVAWTMDINIASEAAWAMKVF